MDKQPSSHSSETQVQPGLTWLTRCASQLNLVAGAILPEGRRKTRDGGEEGRMKNKPNTLHWMTWLKDNNFSMLPRDAIDESLIKTLSDCLLRYTVQSIKRSRFTKLGQSSFDRMSDSIKPPDRSRLIHLDGCTVCPNWALTLHLSSCTCPCGTAVDAVHPVLPTPRCFHMWKRWLYFHRQPKNERYTVPRPWQVLVHIRWAPATVPFRAWNGIDLKIWKKVKGWDYLTAKCTKGDIANQMGWHLLAIGLFHACSTVVLYYLFLWLRR